MEGANLTQNVSNGIFNQVSVKNTLLTLVVISAILFVFKYLFIRRNKFKKLPPGPTGIPIFGYLPFLGNEPYKTFDHLGKKYGNVFGLYLGRHYVVVCNDWESKKDAFSNISIIYRPLGVFDAVPNGLGFANANGQEWVEQRRYSMKLVKDVGLGKPKWEEMLQDEVNDAIKVLENSEGHPVSLNQMFSSGFTNSVIALLFGNRLPYNHPTTLFLSETMDEMMKAIFPLSFSFLFPNFSSFLTKLGLYGSKEILRKINKFSAYIEKAVKRILQEKESSSEITFVKLYNEAVENNKKLDLKNSFTETSLYANVQSLLLGGSDTTKTGIIWILIAMAQYPEVQRKVYEELYGVIGREDRIKWSERNTIPYTYACILESLRWRTIAPTNTLRMTSEDTEILGYHVPKGSIVTANNWAIHKETKYWPNPEKFDPKRFLVDGRLKSKIEAYTPFSNGRRNCPGEHVALVSILQYFTRLMQKFEVLPEDGKTVKYEISLGLLFKPKEIKLRFVLRE